MFLDPKRILFIWPPSQLNKVTEGRWLQWEERFLIFWREWFLDWADDEARLGKVVWIHEVFGVLDLSHLSGTDDLPLLLVLLRIDVHPVYVIVVTNGHLQRIIELFENCFVYFMNAELV